MHATFQHDGLTTTARVESEFYEFTGEGVARCRPEDHYVPGLGERIALGRAIQALGKSMEETHLVGSITEAQWRAQALESTDESKIRAMAELAHEAAQEIEFVARTPMAVSL